MYILYTQGNLRTYQAHYSEYVIQIEFRHGPYLAPPVLLFTNSNDYPKYIGLNFRTLTLGH